MKPLSALIAFSLAANVALLAVLVVRTKDSLPPALAAASSAAVSAASPTVEKKSATATSASTDSRQTWDRLRTDDLAALVTRLRAAGFPETVVRKMIGTLVSERFDARRLELEKANLEAPFWKTATNSSLDPKIGPELRNLQREQTELMKQLLGGSLADLFAGTEEDRAMLRFQIGDIPPGKLEALYAAAMNYSEKMMQVYAASSAGGNRQVMLDSDKEKLVAFDKAYREDLGKFLTPAEVNDFMMHNGQMASQLRSTLAPMKPTEEEYRAIFSLTQAFQDQNPTINPTYLPPDASAAARAAVDQLKAQIAAALDPSRAADFAQLANPGAAQLNRLVARLDLPLSAAAQVSAVQADIQQRAAALRTDSSLAGPARAAQLTSLAEEASTKISAALGGQRGLDAYKEYGGQWIANLAPRPRPPAPAPKG